ncbi:tRNA (adenine(22)-N(1))-methyltransferase TrmK [Bdellovibrio sp. HCB337]|uniref:tRNA (adenine(22)-N(1))-methyltransferase TrmK n=1 Tax=Bdellovibrio sp. HCB337 TaxID=3394358 RepID=UPI0039A40513
MILSERLQLIYENLLPEKAVWDFCCDHGYLGVEALKSRRFSEVYFVDQVPHIIQGLEKTVREKFSEVSSQAHFKISKGEEVDCPVTGNVVIAGVGAFAIFKIIKSLFNKNFLQAERLILCPQRDEQKFMDLLSALGASFTDTYSIHQEIVCTERRRQRHIYIVQRSTN